jgi:hypothetical protein
MKRAFPLIIITILIISGTKINSQSTGCWNENSAGLPVYQYKGSLDFSEFSKGNFPNDPWFILGNYRLIVFPHASGQYEMVTGERAWSMVNHLQGLNGGNYSSIQIGNAEAILLTGMKSKQAHTAEKVFGTGYASYTYNIDGIRCERSISSPPSKKINDGIPAVMIQVVLTNTTGRKKEIRFTEAMAANYIDFRDRSVIADRRKVRNIPFKKAELSGFAEVGFRAEFDDPHLIPLMDQPAKYDGFPPTVFMKGSENAQVLVTIDTGGMYWLVGNQTIDLRKNESKTIRFVTGISFDEINDNPLELSRILLSCASNNPDETPFLTDWKSKLPVFPNEKDSELKKEMIWNAYVLEVMATYSSFYKETYIPQGCAYEFGSGSIAGSRDHLQHSLPLVYYNTELARSIILYIIKKMLRTGEIPFTESGVGFTSDMKWRTSDQQLFLFMALSEYLRVSGDYKFLSEKVPNIWSNFKMDATIFNYIETAYIYFRDEIRTGANNLPRLMNSDWNDQLVAHAKENVNFFQASSHLNAAMAVVTLKSLADGLSRARERGVPLPDNSGGLISSMHHYASEIYDALWKEMEDRDFSRRAWYNNDLAIGEDILYLSPQSYILQIPDFPLEKKQILLESIEKRLMNGEVLGARSRETSENSRQNAGEGENGGVWYALNGPAIAGVAGFDKDKALEMLKKLGFSNYSRNFPNYWIGHWSGADHFSSSLSDYPGMVNRVQKPMVQFPVFCGHAHAWPLYCYFKIIDQ